MGFMEWSIQKKIKVVNVILSTMIITIGVLQILQSRSFTEFLVPGYLIFFGFLMISGDIEIKYVLGICGFLGNFYGRAIFIVYCGVNILIFGAREGSAITALSIICGWVCIGFGFLLGCLKYCAKSDSLLTAELDTYLDKHKAAAPVEGEAATTA